MRIDAAKRLRVVSPALLLAAALAGCGSDEKPKEEIPPTRIVATVTASADTNPGATGVPSPIFVRLYELKANTAFATAGFFALWDDDQKTLGKDLESRQDLVLTPGQSMKVEREFADGSRFLGVAAAYRDVENATWRALTPVPAHQTTTMTVDVGRADVLVTVKKPDPPSDEKAKKDGKKEDKKEGK